MPQSRRIYFLAGLVYLLFVVYGSLVPLDFHPRSLNVALKDFAHIRYLHLGIASRADWVANIILYVPLAYLWLGCLSRDGRIFRQTFFSIVVFIFCVALSIAIEFVQQFFPPRTVSLNDIIAEVLGSAIGIALWWFSGKKLRSLFETLLAQGRNAAYAGLILYTVAYLAFSLFPYDFLISEAEIRVKLAGGFLHWLPSQTSCGNTMRCSAKLFAEAAAVVPLGLLMGMISRKSGAALVLMAALIGMILGLIIESAQFFLASGLTLGISVLTRLAGVAAGAALGEMLRQSSVWPLLYLLRPLMPVTALLHMVLLAALTWLGKGSLLSAEAALGRLHQIYFMPFYYHYYTSESEALASLLASAIMYLPFGIIFWIWRVTQMREFVARGALQAGLLSALIAAGIETGKLFFAEARPDPTDVLIAAASAACGFIVLSMGTKAILNLDFTDQDIITDESHAR